MTFQPKAIFSIDDNDDDDDDKDDDDENDDDNDDDDERPFCITTLSELEFPSWSHF